MKKLLAFSTFFVFLFVFTQNILSQTIVYNSEVKGKWTKAKSPYIILRNITVPLDTSLTIEPGVEVQFATGIEMIVKGNLKAIGTPFDKIIFTSADTSSVKNDITMGWGRIAILNAGKKDTSVFENCILEYGYTTNYDNPLIQVKNRSIVINKCIIRKNRTSQSAIIACENEANALIINSSFTDNTAMDYSYGIHISQSKATIANNLIHRTCITIGSKNAASDTIRLFNNTIVQNPSYNYLIRCAGIAKMQNCIIRDSLNEDNQLIDIYNSGYMLLENCILKKSGVKVQNSSIVFKNVYDIDPSFIDPKHNNFQLSSGSFGINSGLALSSKDLSLMPNDISGNGRINLTDGESKIDIGAYEYQGIISNRPPSINNPGITHILTSSSKEMTFDFSDVDENDSHTLNVSTDNPNLTLTALSSQTNKAKYTINPVKGWEGSAKIFMEVTDKSGSKDIDSFVLVVNKKIDYDISGHTIWDADTVYIEKSFSILSDASLEIKPGTCVLFRGSYLMDAKGVIKANGTPDRNITFTSSDTTGFFQNENKGWRGIILSNREDSSFFNNCIFEYVRERDLLRLAGTKAGIFNCIFRYFKQSWYNYGVIKCYSAKLFIGNCLFYNNSSRDQIISSEYSDLKLYNNIFYNNKSAYGSLSLIGGNIVLKNTIFWGNQSGYAREITSSLVKLFEISNCVFEKWDESISSSNPINSCDIFETDPQFTDVSKMDFHLQQGSPLINNGAIDAFLTKNINTDIEGKSRIFPGTVSLPDIGAYEYQGEPVNRKPLLEKMKDKYSMLGNAVSDTIHFFDPDNADTHTITVLSNNANVSVHNLSGNTSGSAYTLIPSAGFNGDAGISVIVRDNEGLRDSVFYYLHVSKSACGSIYKDMTWDDDTIQVICDVTVEKGAKLTIKPGVKVIFNGPYALNVFGTLSAEGTVNDTILFTLNDTVTFNETVFTNAWRGIKINPPYDQGENKLTYCEISKSKDRGLYLDKYSNAIISNCNIHHNLSEGSNYGGGIYSSCDSSIIENNSIHHNKSAYNGGGIFIRNEKGVIKNNKIFNNTADEGGGIYSYSFNRKYLFIEENEIEFNTATYARGGGIYADGNETIKNNIIRNNHAYASGGGIYGDGTSYIINNIIEGNICENASGNGGGIYTGYGNSFINNNLIINNYANNGSGIYSSSFNGLFVNNTICNNMSANDGIYFDGTGTPTLINNILWGNGTSLSKTQLYVSKASAMPNIKYCVIEGGKEKIGCASGVTFTGEYQHNFDIYPFFKDSVNHNFSLSDGSICINSGIADTTGLKIPVTDFSGSPRIFAGNVARIDIGAYEYSGEPVNRKPVLDKVPDIHLLSSQTKKMKLEYSDNDHNDTHNISVESDNPNLSIANLSGGTTNSTYNLTTTPDWIGAAKVKVKVKDANGLKDSIYYTVTVSDSICGKLTDNLIWDTDTVFITCDVEVPAGKTLRILPGTVVFFKEKYKMTIYGALIAEGTAEKHIKFTYEDTTKVYQYNYWGGIYFSKPSGNTDTSKLTYCDILRSRNIEIKRDNVIVSNCLFKNGYSFTNAGGISIINSAPVVKNSIFDNNKGSYGGAICCKIDDDKYYSANMPLIEGNVFYNNSASRGGAVCCYESSAIIRNNIMYNNRSSYGAAVCFYNDNYKYSVFQNNLIYNNYATSFGGAVYYYDCRVNQMNNTIVKNTSRVGGALYFEEDGEIQMINDIIYYNKATLDQGSQIYFYDSYSVLDVKNCFIQYGGDDVEGYGATYAIKEKFNAYKGIDPAFADTSVNNFHLSDSSFCINNGTTNAKGMLIPEYDIDGNPRIFAGSPANIDAGTFEFQGNPKNRKPCITRSEDQYTFIADRKKLSVNFTDADVSDHHIITIASQNTHIVVENLSGNTSGSTYELVPTNEWKGVSQIYVKVEDDKGNYAIDTFKLTVSEYYCGSITENKVWIADTVKISCDVTIEKNATLTILPGTVVIFDAYSQLKVFGRLIAEGLKEKQIVFTASDTSQYGRDAYKGWRGIRFYGPNNSDTSKLVYCIIKYAKGLDKGFVNDKCGGGLYTQDWNRLLISNCRIYKNAAVTSGGGIYTYFSGVTITDNIISNNYSINGGGLYISYSPYPYFYLVNNIICNNEATSDGGGIYCTNLLSINNHIVNNKASRGGGLFIEGGSQDLYNTIIWGNEATGNYYPQIYASYSSFVYLGLNNSVLDTNQTNLPSTYAFLTTKKSIIANPKFISPSVGAGKNYDGLTANWYLKASSPCINKGTTSTNIYLYSFPVKDISGGCRILMDTIDIGAYEYKNYAPEKVYEIATLVVTESIPCSLVFNDVFTDPDINENLTLTVIGLPQWINLTILNKSMSITGTPGINDIGIKKVVVTATDRFNATVTDTFEISVLKNNPPILQNKLSDITLMPLETLNYKVPENSFIDPDVNDLLSYSASLLDGTNLPAWLTFDPENKTFQGIAQKDVKDMSILLTVTDLAGNTSSDTLQIKVSVISNTNLISKESFKVYPLPATSVVYIELTDDRESSDVKIELYDLKGSRISFPDVKKHNRLLQVDVSSLPSGFYSLHIIKGDAVKKFNVPKYK